MATAMGRVTPARTLGIIFRLLNNRDERRDELQREGDPAPHGVYQPPAPACVQLLDRDAPLGDLRAIEQLRAEGPRQQATLDWRRDAGTVHFDDHIEVGRLGNLVAVVPENDRFRAGTAAARAVVDVPARGFVEKEYVGGVNWVRGQRRMQRPVGQRLEIRRFTRDAAFT